MVVDSPAATHFHLAARNAPRSGLTFEVKLRPFGGHNIADPRSGIGNQAVSQPHARCDRSNFCTTKHVPQLRERQERRMVNDVRCALQYLDDRFSGVVWPQAFGLCEPEDRTNMLQDLLRRVPHACLLYTSPSPRD